MNHIAEREGSERDVSGEGGSCYYRAVAYRACELDGRAYDDAQDVAELRNGVSSWLHLNRNESSPSGIRWGEMGTYLSGFAEAPVPQAMPHVIKVTPAGTSDH